MNYYNENDPKAAAWLRELIKAGAIPEGEVDERSIEDVSVTSLIGYDQHHFFAGIGGWSLALSLAGWPEDKSVWTGSCPCQPFSAAGKRKGTTDERHLWPAWQWLIKQYRPDCIFGEQVASKDGIAWLDTVSTDLEGEGYAVAPIVLPACSVGAFHKRERLWFVADSDHRRPAIEKPRQSLSEAGGTHQLAKPETLGRAPWRSSEAREGSLESQRSRSTCDSVADTESNGRIERRSEPNWRSAEWYRCKDGKHRAIEPGIQPLAHGVSGRVGLLRGYGNAIVPQVASEMIRAYMECRSV